MIKQNKPTLADIVQRLNNARYDLDQIMPIVWDTDKRRNARGCEAADIAESAGLDPAYAYAQAYVPTQAERELYTRYTEICTIHSRLQRVYEKLRYSKQS